VSREWKREGVMDGESGELTEWEEVVGAWTGRTETEGLTLNEWRPWPLEAYLSTRIQHLMVHKIVIHGSLFITTSAGIFADFEYFYRASHSMQAQVYANIVRLLIRFTRHWHFINLFEISRLWLFIRHCLSVYYADKIIQDHRFWYQSKAHIRLPISD